MSAASVSPSLGDTTVDRVGLMMHSSMCHEMQHALECTFLFLFQVLLYLCWSDEPLNEVIVRLLHAWVAGVVDHTSVVHF
jgi:hypothetical protein